MPPFGNIFTSQVGGVRALQYKETANNDIDLRETERDVLKREEEGSLSGLYCVWVGNGNSNRNVY